MIHSSKINSGQMKKLLVIFILFFIPQLVSAGVISLTTTVSSDIITGDIGRVHVKLLNSGNEAAYDVQISLLTESFESNPIHLGKLNPNEPAEEDFEIRLKRIISPGRYPATIIVDYTDANGYPFSSVSSSFIVFKNSTVSKISGLISETSLSGKESKILTLSVRNLDDEEHDVDVKLILPREIKVVDAEKKISIGPKQEKSLDFEVSSLSAIPGSTYAILASIEYEDDMHYTSFANGIIRIDGGAASKEPEGSSILAYVILFISMVFILIYAYPKYIKRGKKVERKNR